MMHRGAGGALGRMAIGVVGLGAMGLGIAQVYAQAGHVVRATDAIPGVRASAMARLAAALAPRVDKGAMTGAARDGVLSRVIVVDRVGDIAPADLVIEAVAEDAAEKRAVLAALATICRRPCLRPIHHRFRWPPLRLVCRHRGGSLACISSTLHRR